MKNALIGLGLLALSACASTANTATAPEPSTLEPTIDPAIEAVVYDYFDGQTEGSAERLNRAFHEDSAMFGVITNDEGEEFLNVWPEMGDVLSAWSSNPNPEAAPRDGEILSVQVTDDRIATVHFRAADRFYDTLTLVKIDGEWKIAAKVFVVQ